MVASIADKPTTNSERNRHSKIRLQPHQTMRLQPGSNLDHFVSVRDCAKPMILVVVRQRMTLVYGITYVPKNKDGKGRHALFLFLAKGLIQRLPRIGEILQIG